MWLSVAPRKPWPVSVMVCPNSACMFKIKFFLKEKGLITSKYFYTSNAQRDIQVRSKKHKPDTS